MKFMDNDKNNQEPSQEELEVINTVKKMYNIYYTTIYGEEQAKLEVPEFEKAGQPESEAWFNVLRIASIYLQKKIQEELIKAKHQQTAKAKALKKSGKIIQLGEKKIIRPT